MSVISCKELPDSRGAGRDKDNKRTYTKAYLVQTNDKNDDEAVILAHGGLPAWNSTHPTDTYARARDFQVNPHGTSRKDWVVEVTYDSTTLEQEVDPRNRPTKWTGRTDEILVPADEDQDGSKIQDKAGTPFNPTLMTKKKIQVLVGRKNVPADFDFNTLTPYEDTTNQFTFRGRDARTVHFRDYTFGEIQKEGEYEFIELVGEFAFNPEGWKEKVPNLGYYQKVGGERKQIIVNGVPASQPMKLKEDGSLADPDDQVVVLEFRMLADSNFGDLPF